MRLKVVEHVNSMCETMSMIPVTACPILHTEYHWMCPNAGAHKAWLWEENPASLGRVPLRVEPSYSPSSGRYLLQRAVRTRLSDPRCHVLCG